MNIQTEIDKTEKEIKDECELCKFAKDMTDLNPPICEFHRGRLTSLQMCKEELEAQIQAHKDFVDKLKIELMSMNKTNQNEGAILSRGQVIEIIDKLSAEMQERGK